jgi:hypothetical protein
VGGHSVGFVSTRADGDDFTARFPAVCTARGLTQRTSSPHPPDASLALLSQTYGSSSPSLSLMSLHCARAAAGLDRSIRRAPAALLRRRDVPAALPHLRSRPRAVLHPRALRLLVHAHRPRRVSRCRSHLTSSRLTSSRLTSSHLILPPLPSHLTAPPLASRPPSHHLTLVRYERISHSVTLLLTAAAYASAVAASLPLCHHLTLLDKYLLACVLLLALCVVETPLVRVHGSHTPRTHHMTRR